MLLDAYTASGAVPAVLGSSVADIPERNTSETDGSDAADLRPGDAVALMDAAVCATISCSAGMRVGPRAPAVFMAGMEKAALALCRGPMGKGTPNDPAAVAGAVGKSMCCADAERRGGDALESFDCCCCCCCCWSALGGSMLKGAPPMAASPIWNGGPMNEGLPTPAGCGSDMSPVGSMGRPLGPIMPGGMTGSWSGCPVCACVASMDW